MKNIEYLKCFFKKHSLNGRVKVKYDKPCQDEYMTDIEFENGDIVNINDVIFDIESELEPDVAMQWLTSKKKNDISLKDWIKSDNHYMPDVDNSAMKEYKKEIEDIWNNAKEKINTILELQDDENDDLS